MKKLSLALIIGLLITIGVVLADVPTTMRMQHIIRNRTTNAVMTGTHNIAYSLIRLSDSSELWSESLDVTLDNGIASVLLGSGASPLEYSFFTEPVKWVLSIDSGTAIEYNETPYGTARVAEYALRVDWTNVSGKPTNLDEDSTDDYSTTNFSNDYYAITSRYDRFNFTTDHGIATHDYVGNCSGANCNIGWGNLSGVPADIADGDNDTTYAADEGNLTLVANVFHLLKINLAEMDNTLDWITNTVSNLANYFTKVEVASYIASNISYHEDTFKHGNTTGEIRAQFSGGDNISIVGGVISINKSFSGWDTDSTDDVTIGADQKVTIAGENITSGIVNEIFIDPAIARNTDLIGNCSGANCEIGWGNLSGVPADIADGDDDYCAGGSCPGDLVIDGSLTILGKYVNATVEEQNLNGSFLPNLNNQFDIGSPARRWANVYATTLDGELGWGNLTDKPSNLDTDSTDDYSTTNFSNDYYAITSRYDATNFTTDHSSTTHDYVGNCSGENCEIGWGNLSGVPADIADGDNDTTYVADEGNLTLVANVFSLLKINLAEMDNSLGWITNTVSNLANYFTKTEVASYIASNISDHEDTFKHGNTTDEIRAQFVSSSNISYDSLTGTFSYNGTTGSGTTYTGGANISVEGDVISINASGWDTNASDDFSGSYNDLTDKPLNIDEDSTNDYTTTNFSDDYYAIDSRYDTTNHSLETHSYISNCSSDGSCSLVVYDGDSNRVRISYRNITDIPTCETDERLTFQGGSLSCVTDMTGGGGGGEGVFVVYGNWIKVNTSVTGIVDDLEINDINITGSISDGVDTYAFADLLYYEADTTIGNCSGANCNIGWGNISGVPAEIADGDSDTTYDSDEVYIYESFDIFYLNETKLNQTTDARYYQKTGVDTKITSANTSMKTYVDAQDISTNTSMRNYVDVKDEAQNECSEITGCVDNAFDNIANFTGTLEVNKWCIYDGSEIDCNVEPVTNTDYCAGGNCDGNLVISGNLTILGDEIVANVTTQNLNGSFLPNLDNQFDIGSNGKIWRNVYASNVYAGTFYGTLDGAYTSTNFSGDYAAMGAYEFTNFSDDYYAIDSRYDTTNHSLETHPYIGNCSGANCNIGWGNLSGVPADIADGDNDTTYTADNGNLTLVANVFSLLKINLAEMDNTLDWITNTVSNLDNYFTKTEVDSYIASNITDHEDTFKHGNTTTEIRAQFVSSSNISYDSLTGTFSYNGTTGSGATYTGGANISIVGDVISVNATGWDTNASDDITTSTTFGSSGGNITGTYDNLVIKACASGQILKYSDNGWICGADNTGGSGTGTLEDVDNLYIYNDSGTITFNESKLNETVKSVKVDNATNADTLAGQIPSYYLDDTTIGNCSISGSCDKIVYTTANLGNTTTEIRSVFGNSSNITYDEVSGTFSYNGTTGSGATYTGGANISIIGGVISVNASGWDDDSSDDLTISTDWSGDLGGTGSSPTVVNTQGLSGENITSGTIADARIASTIARDSELIGNCSDDQSCDNIVYTTDNLGNTTDEIWSAISNQTWDERINEVNTSENIESFGFNVTIDLKAYFNTLYMALANLANSIQNQSIIRSGLNESWVNDTVDEPTIIRNWNTSWITANQDRFDPSGLEIVNTTMLDNTTIVRSYNTSWIRDNQNNFDPSGLEIVNTTMLDNGSIVRSYNTSWITDNQGYNTTTEIFNAVNNGTFVMNNSDATLTNLTMSDGAGLGMNIWFNGTGICIGTC